MIIWRVEDERGHGPFDCYSVSGPLTEVAHHSGLIPYTQPWFHMAPLFPCPNEDGLNQWHGQYCGLQSEALFDEWWPQLFYRTIAAESGNRLGRATFEAPDDDVTLGARQCIFRRERARRLSFVTFGVLMLRKEYQSCQSAS